MKMKKFLSMLLVALFMVSLLSGCAGTSETPAPAPAATAPASQAPVAPAAPAPASPAEKTDNTVYTMRIGTLAVPPNQCPTTAEEFKKRIEEASARRIKVQVYPGAQLGTAAQMLEGMQAGSVEAGIFPANFTMTVAPIMGFVEVPGVVANDSRSFCDILNKNNNEVLNKYFNKAGLHLAAWVVTDSTKFFLSTKEITSFADAKGMKIWGFPNDYTKSLITSMGAIPTFFDTSDLPVSLQQGTIDGVMAAPTLYAPQKLYEYAKYCMKLPGFGGGNAFMMGTAFLDKLPADLRQMVLDVTMETINEYTNDYGVEFASTAIKVLETNGCKVYDPSEKFQSELNAAFEPMLAMWLKIDGAPELYKELTALKTAK